MSWFRRKPKADLFDTLYGPGSVPTSRPKPKADVPSVPARSADLANVRSSPWSGEKFHGGFGTTEVYWPDYWTLRKRSAQLYRSNLYARGLLRRLVTNEINTGLQLEATPEQSILGLTEEWANEWSEDVETRFKLWADDPRLCDYTECQTFGQLQAQTRLEALVCGDVLVTQIVDQRTGLPRIKLTKGSLVATPVRYSMGRVGKNRIRYGVETDPAGRHVAYHVTQEDRTSKRVLARGPKTGRRMAWLVYGTDKRVDNIRGEPLLSLMLQSLREIDRYRDSTQRKRWIESLIAVYIEKGEDALSSLPFEMGAHRRGTETVVDTQGTERSLNFQEQTPGMVWTELQKGEKPHSFQGSGGTERFGEFEEVIIQAIAWANEIPPEVLRLSFSHNYSASQAAINEFKLYLNPTRERFADQFCEPVYHDWLLSSVIRGKVEAPGLFDAFRRWAQQHDIYRAWVASDWAGQIKPSTDLLKMANGYAKMVEEGFITRSRASRELTGMKYSKLVKLLARENEQLAEANKPMLAKVAKTLAPPVLANDADEDDPDADDRKEDEEAA